MNRNSRDIQAHVRYGDISVAIVAEGISWSPDAADDLVRRVQDLWRGALETMYDFGMIDTGDDEDEFGPTPDRELIDPRTVFLEGNDG